MQGIFQKENTDKALKYGIYRHLPTYEKIIRNLVSFLANKACEYFPCHPVDDPDSFNCLFCYCPLYLQEKCLGSPEWILSGKGQKIKDCSNCMVVHRPEMYDKVLAQLCRQDFTVSVNVWNFRNEIWRRMAQIASWDQMEAELFWQHRGAAISSVTNMMEKHKYLYRVTIKLQPFDAACVQNDRFSFGKQEIFCTVLERIDRSKITEGYLYAFHAPDFPVEEASSLLSQYYLETFQIACMDVVREWVRDYLARKHSVTSPHYCSDSFGPGYYGMELSVSICVDPHPILMLVPSGSLPTTYVLAPSASNTLFAMLNVLPLEQSNPTRIPS